MAKRKKWDIPRLGTETRFRSAARRILAYRLRDVLTLSSAFQSDREVKTLHDLRIAVRRLRYPLEALHAPFRRSVILDFLEELNAVQDALGYARDLDVFIEKLTALPSAKRSATLRTLMEQLREQRETRYAEAVARLGSFTRHPTLFAFTEQIGYAGFHAEFSRDEDGEGPKRRRAAPAPDRKDTPS